MRDCEVRGCFAALSHESWQEPQTVRRTQRGYPPASVASTDLSPVPKIWWLAIYRVPRPYTEWPWNSWPPGKQASITNAKPHGSGPSGEFYQIKSYRFTVRCLYFYNVGSGFKGLLEIKGCCPGPEGLHGQRIDSDLWKEKDTSYLH